MKTFQLVKKTESFTLIELIVVMMIVSSLALLIIGNFTSTLKRGRDAKRKADLALLRQVLETYYEDKRSYPPIPADEYEITNHIVSPEGFIRRKKAFIDTASGKMYMGRLPDEPNPSYEYVYTTDSLGTYYRLFSCIENKDDTGEGVSHSGFTGAPTTCGCSVCNYTVSSPNITPLPTISDESE